MPYAARARRRESIEISTTDERISNVPSQSGRVKLMPSNSSDNNALLSGSAQLRMLALARQSFAPLSDTG